MLGGGRTGVLIVTGWMVACGTPSQAPPGELASLVPLPLEIVSPGEPFEAMLVGDGVPPSLEIVQGAPPDGLYLSADGRLTGIAQKPGQVGRFTLRARGWLGEPLEERCFLVAVGVDQTNLPAPPDATRIGDVLDFHHDWGRPLQRAWGWDPQLGLAWPMRVGAGFVGRALAPAGGSFSMIVAGPQVQGQFALEHDALDPRAHVVAQLVWEGEVDIDLHLVPDDALGGEELSPRVTDREKDGQWEARHLIAETSWPGPEVVALANDAPVGRWALVATKAAGDEVEVPLWLSVRRRDGQVLAEKRIDALFSDLSSGLARDDAKARRQAYRPLGVIEIGPDHDVRFLPVEGGGLFGAHRSAEAL